MKMNKLVNNIVTKTIRKELFPNYGPSIRKQNFSSRKLIVSILNSTATKREAKDYLAKYTDEPNIINYSFFIIRDLHLYNSRVLKQLSSTIRRLRILGLRPLMILPPTPEIDKNSEYMDKLITHARLRPLHLDNALVKRYNGSYESILSQRDNGLFDNSIPTLVPIIKPIIYDERTASTHLSEDFIHFMKHFSRHPIPRIDKVFILNKIGGIPSGERNDNAHVFINLSQEFESMSKSLLNDFELINKKQASSDNLIERMNLHIQKDYMNHLQLDLREHWEDLQLMNGILNNLPVNSTGLITNINSAALSSDTNNPLLYNLLTDRSLISSSLPRFKRSYQNNSSLKSDEEALEWDADDDLNKLDLQLLEKQNYQDAVLATTVVKRGVGIKVLEYKTLSSKNSIGLPSKAQLPGSYSEQTKSQCTKVDLLKMKKILDQSFKRSIDLEHFMKRINGKIASIIIIGNYEGIAILTYEGPPGNEFVYLDKFAVLPHLKGSLGISDIIFNLMFKKFPKEVVWRSRKDNVVNKWYFQRSVAVIDLSVDIGNENQQDSNFQLFYYGDPNSVNKSVNNLKRLKELVKYVRDIKPSWHK